jgi:transposase-like protein
VSVVFAAVTANSFVKQLLRAKAVLHEWPCPHSTNLLSAPSSEVSRRTKVIGRVPGETSALCLISAALEFSPRARVTS